MGKLEDDEFSVPSSSSDERVNVGRSGFNFSKFIGIKCLLILLLGFSVFLSALFLLPPFLKLKDPTDLDLDPRFRGHTVVASFTVNESVSLLKDNIENLEADIYYELEVAHTKVTILSVERSPGSNTTYVVFVVDPESKHSSISPAGLSLIRASFASIFTNQTTLRLPTISEKPSSFEILKFPGGITIIPDPHSFPLQNVQISFNFTLNNSIAQIQNNIKDFQHQLKAGLHLTENELLHIQVTNFRGSTVTTPATVQALVVLAVGVPSVPRLKQLAQTIKDSPGRNLGLNNRVFGKVKQVSLSSVLPHSLNGDASSPSPSPLPHSHHHHHHHHHHDHHHHQYHGTYLPPSKAPSYSPIQSPTQPIKGSPTPKRRAHSPVESHQAAPIGAPTPQRGYLAKPPTTPPPFKSYQASPPGCGFRSKSKHTGKAPVQAPSPTSVAVEPVMSPHHSAVLPHRHASSPKPVVHHISPSSPLPNVIYARVPPPSGTIVDSEPPDKLPSIALSPSGEDRIRAIHWGLSVLVVMLLQLW